MDAILMCGGRGTRLGADGEKPLHPVGGRPMVDRVRDALAASRVGTVYAVGSPHTPRTNARLGGTAGSVDSESDVGSGSDDRRELFVEAPGEGYVADLRHALERVDPPVLTVAADLPLLAGDAVDAVLDGFEGASITVCVPAALKRELGASVDTTTTVDDRELAPTGVNVVSGADGGDENGGGDVRVSYDARLAVNVNRPSDVRLAEALL